jgi:site-specific recombinase XerD
MEGVSVGSRPRRRRPYHGNCPPTKLGKREVEQFLTHLAVDRKVSASTQNQPLAAILFLYKHVLGRELEWLDNVVRAKRPERLPVVLTRQEVEALLVTLDGVPWFMATLLYGSRLRLMECLGLRVKDIDRTRHEALVRQGKGNKDRVTMLSTAAAPKLQAHPEGVRELHNTNLVARLGRVALPDAIRPGRR